MTHPPETRGGIVTSWLPATETNSAPVACSSAIFAAAAVMNPFSALAFDPYYNEHFDSALTCLPDAATSWFNQVTRSSYSQTVTSIGPMICPDLYTTALTSILDASSTIVACCPSNYGHTAIYTNTGLAAFLQCTSAVSAGQVLTWWAVTPSATTPLTTTVGTSALVFALPFNGYQFAVAADPTTTQASSTSTSTSASNTAAASTSSIINTSIPTSTSISTPTSTPTSAPLSTHGSSTNIALPATNKSLSTAASAGVGVGVTLAVLGTIALIVSLIFIRRNNAKKRRLVSNRSAEDSYTGLGHTGGTNGTIEDNEPRYEMGAQDLQTTKRLYALKHKEPHEMDSGREDYSHELSGQSKNAPPAHEML